MVMEIRAFCCRGFRGTSLAAAWMTMISALLSIRTMPISSREQSRFPRMPTTAQINQCTLFVNGVRMCGVRTPQKSGLPAHLSAS